MSDSSASALRTQVVTTYQRTQALENLHARIEKQIEAAQEAKEAADGDRASLTKALDALAAAMGVSGDAGLEALETAAADNPSIMEAAKPTPAAASAKPGKAGPTPAQAASVARSAKAAAAAEARAARQREEKEVLLRHISELEGTLERKQRELTDLRNTTQRIDGHLLTVATEYAQVRSRKPSPPSFSFPFSILPTVHAAPLWNLLIDPLSVVGCR